MNRNSVSHSTRRRRRVVVVAAVAALFLSAGGAVASGAPADRQPAATYTGCVDSLGNVYNVAAGRSSSGTCHLGESVVKLPMDDMDGGTSGFEFGGLQVLGR